MPASKIDNFSVSFLKGNGDLKEKSIQRWHLSSDIYASGVFASGYFDHIKIGGPVPSGYVLTSDANGWGTFQEHPLSPFTRFPSTGSIYPTILTDKLGIGTNSPSTALQVNGTTTTNSINVVSGGLYKYNDLTFGFAQTALNNYYFGGAGNSVGTGINNSALGYQSFWGNASGSYNSALGVGSLFSNIGGFGNSALGVSALRLNIGGYQNSAFGQNALFSNTEGYQNSAVGVNSLFSNTTGFFNTAAGYCSLWLNTDGSYNSAFGEESLYLNTTGYSNTAVGVAALHDNTTGYSNTAIGMNALITSSTANTCSALGVAALYWDTTGSDNTAIGYYSLSNITIGNRNTALGVNAGRYITGFVSPNVTSENSVYLGMSTMAKANGDTNEIVIGYSAVGHGSNTVTLGNGSITDNYLTGNLNLSATISASGVITTSPWFDVRAFGALGNGTTDDSAAVLAAITACYNTGGGTILFPKGTYRIDSQIRLPNDGKQFHVNSVYPQQPTFRFIGVGGGGDSTWLDGHVYPLPQAPSVLDLRYVGGPYEAKIMTHGKGLVEIANLQLIDSTDGTTPFIQTTNSQLNIHDCSIIGKIEATASVQPTQDAIICGGFNLAHLGDLYDDSPFQGYITVINNVYFSRIQRGVYLKCYANAVQIVHCWWTLGCGGLAAIEADGVSASGVNGGTYCCGNTIEMLYYTNGVKLNYHNDGFFIGNWLGDVTPGLTGVFWNIANSTNNWITHINDTITTCEGNYIFGGRDADDGLEVPNNITATGSISAFTDWWCRKIQTTNDLGGKINFLGGSIGNTPRGCVGFGHTGSGTDTIFTGELVDSISLKSYGAMHFGTNGDAIAMTIDTLQRVGIGTSVPGVKLEVNGAVAITNESLNLTVTSNDEWSKGIQWYKSRGAGDTVLGDNLGYLSFAGKTSSTSRIGGYLSIDIDGTPTASSIPTSFTFFSGTPITQLMKISSSGIIDVNGDVNLTPGSHYKVNGANLSYTDLGAAPTVNPIFTGSVDLSNASLNIAVSTNDQYSQGIQWYKSRSTNDIQNGDTLGYLSWAGQTNSVERLGGYLSIDVDGTPTSTSVPVSYNFYSGNPISSVAKISCSGVLTVSDVVSKSPSFDVRAYGALGNGTTDDSTAVLAAITAAYNSGGGTVLFPKGTYRVDSQIALANDGKQLSINGVYPQQPTIRLVGMGGGGDSTWLYGSSFTAPTAPSVIDLRYAGSVAKIVTKGKGLLEIANLQLKDTTDGTLPFVLTTNTTLKIHDCSFIGKTEAVDATLAQDIIILGGNNIAHLGDLDNDAPFQGYVTTIENNYFNNLRKILLNKYVNGVTISKNFWALGCGGDCALEMIGDVGEYNSRNFITGNAIEVGHYNYGIKLKYAKYNYFFGNGLYDATPTTITLWYMDETLNNSIFCDSDSFSGGGAPFNQIIACESGYARLTLGHFDINRWQGADDIGAYMTFTGSTDGITKRGYFGFAHLGTGGDTIFTGELASAICLRSQNALQFGTNGDHIAVTIDTSQRLGVGTAVPSVMLDVEGGSDYIARFHNGFPVVTLEGDWDAGASIDFKNTGAGSGTAGIKTRVGRGIASGTSVFEVYDQVQGKSRILVDPSGYIGLTLASPTHLIHLNGGAYCDGTGDWIAGSDLEYKKDIDYDFKYGIKEIEKLRPVYYVHKQDESNKKQIGFIAQDMRKIIPEIVSGSEGELGLSYGQLTAVLVRAVQEQQQEINELKLQINKLGAHNNTIER